MIKYGIAENNAANSTYFIIDNEKFTFNAIIELMVLNGLKTLKLLKDYRFILELFPNTNGINELTTMQKSRIFQPSLK